MANGIQHMFNGTIPQQLPWVANITGGNPGPAMAWLYDTVQYPVGNIWKWGVFPLTVQLAQVDEGPSMHTFSNTGIGAQPGDVVLISAPDFPGLSGTGTVTGPDTIDMALSNGSGDDISPPGGNLTLQVMVIRPQPNWTVPRTGQGYQLGW